MARLCTNNEIISITLSIQKELEGLSLVDDPSGFRKKMDVLKISTFGIQKYLVMRAVFNKNA